MASPLSTQIGDDLKVAAILNVFFHHGGNLGWRVMPNFLRSACFQVDSRFYRNYLVKLFARVLLLNVVLLCIVMSKAKFANYFNGNYLLQ